MIDFIKKTPKIKINAKANSTMSTCAVYTALWFWKDFKRGKGQLVCEFLRFIGWLMTLQNISVSIRKVTRGRMHDDACSQGFSSTYYE